MDTGMILILGLTASGKGKLAFELAKRIGAEVISVDSMKVYRRMDIGTAKPSREAQRQVRYHLIDVIEPSEFFSVAAFLELVESAIEQIKAKNRPVIAVGGTAMYLKALLFGLFEGPGTDEQLRSWLKQRIREEGSGRLHKQLAQMDPVAAERISPNDSRRIIRALEVYELTGRPISSMQTQFTQARPLHNWKIIGLRRDKADTAHRINMRAKMMIEQGLVDEAKSLLAEEKSLSPQARCAIGYAEIIEYLDGKYSLDDALELIRKNTRKFAKSQRTWFKTFRNVNWLDIAPEESAEEILERTIRMLEQAKA
jgi:tRNA dimethylallyltransferase